MLYNFQSHIYCKITVEKSVLPVGERNWVKNIIAEIKNPENLGPIFTIFLELQNSKPEKSFFLLVQRNVNNWSSFLVHTAGFICSVRILKFFFLFQKWFWVFGQYEISMQAGLLSHPIRVEYWIESSWIELKISSRWILF